MHEPRPGRGPALPGPEHGAADPGPPRPDEELDVVEPTGAPAGRLPRSRVHRDGLWHQVFHCLLVRSGPPPRRVVLQRRHRWARSFPGLLELTVTGHLLAGETPQDGVREVQEEIGLHVAAAQLVPLGRRLLADDLGEGRNREIAHAHLLVDDTPLTDFDLEHAEVEGLVEVTTADLLAVLGDPSHRAPAEEVDTSGNVTTCMISLADLVAPLDGYWVVVVTMAERYALGERVVAV